MTTPALVIDQLTKIYSSGVKALKGISFEVQQGDFFALLGPNGAGKSTTIGIISSLINKTSGKVKVFDTDLDQDISKVKSYLGLVPQEFNFNIFEPTLEIVVNQAGFYGIPRKKAFERAEIYLTQLGLWEKRNTSARELSGGMKRRLMIARALVHQPRLLILDEPTAGVDIEIRRSMWEFLRKINAEGTTIILTTHYLEEAENLCRHIAIIDGGEIIENTAMKTLLGKLQTETLILDLKSPLKQLPVLKQYQATLVDSTTIEIEISKQSSLNAVFAQLSTAGVEVVSMRNKSNRLEQLFVSLVKNGKSP